MRDPLLTRRLLSRQSVCAGRQGTRASPDSSSSILFLLPIPRTVSVAASRTRAMQAQILMRPHGLTVSIKMASLLVVFILLSLCLSTQATEVDSSVQQISAANSQFAINLYQQLQKGAKEGNIFYSPFSVSSALAMTYLGADGQTADEMATVLGFSGQDSHVAFKKILTTLDDPTNNYTLAIANRLFGSQLFEFKQTFIQKAEEYYGAGLETMDFKGEPEVSRERINNWVENRTEDKIKDLLPEGAVTPGTIMFLVNAIYFNALWKFPFDKKVTKTGPFLISNENSVDMDFMTIKERFNLWKRPDLGARILEVPYAGGEVCMYIVLPDDVQGLPEVERKLTLSVLPGVSDQQDRPEKVRLSLPKFKLEQTVNMKTLLHALGIKELFSPRANMAGIGQNLMVQEVIHKAFIDVDEEGTEAAAATGVQIVLTSVQLVEEFKADHPFFFYIRELVTDNVLFMGRLTGSPDPAAVIGVFNAQQMDDGGSALHAASLLTWGAALTLCVIMRTFS